MLENRDICLHGADIGLVGRALGSSASELIPTHSPEARGRLERMFGILGEGLPQELRLAGITDMVEANRFLEVFLPQAQRLRVAEDRGTAFVPFTGAPTSFIHEERTVLQTTTRWR